MHEAGRATASVFDRAAVEAWRRARRLDPQVVRTLRTRLFKRFSSDDEVWGDTPPDERLASELLELAERRDSTLDGASKLLLRTRDDRPIETVILRPATGRTTLCVSSQSGCAAGCVFCATGRMTNVRSLTAAEILSQVRIAGRLLRDEDRRIRNVVFMGMGEPLHNEAAMYEALELLAAPDYFALSPAKSTVSTVGVPDGMLRLARKFPQVRIALSLHSARQELRERLVPTAIKHPLERLRDAVRGVNAIAGAPVMIEYLLLAGVNDADRDVDALLDWLDGLHVHVNLIPYNAIPEAPDLTGSDDSTRERFTERLRGAGYVTTSRYSLGQDIAAACGQLAQGARRSKRTGREPAG